MYMLSGYRVYYFKSDHKNCRLIKAGWICGYGALGSGGISVLLWTTETKNHPGKFEKVGLVCRVKWDCLVQFLFFHLRYTSSHPHPRPWASRLPYLPAILAQILLSTHLIPPGQFHKPLTLCLSQCWSHGRNSTAPVKFHWESTNSYLRDLCARHNWCKKQVPEGSGEQIGE